MAVSDYSTKGKEIGVADTTLPVNQQAVQGFANALETFKDYSNTKKVNEFGQQERAQYESYVDFSKQAGIIEEGLRLQGESANRSLTPEEQTRVKEFEDMAKMDEDAYKQGVMNRNRYQLNAQRRLRAAITERPDLAEEFRRTSVKEIGTDVSTYALQYYWENLDAAGKALEKKPLSPTDLDKRFETGQEVAKTMSAEEQADFVQTTQIPFARAMMAGDFARADSVLRSYEGKNAGNPAVDQVEQVNGFIAGIDSNLETLDRESALMADANYASVLAADDAAATGARTKLLGLKSALQTQIGQLSSYKGSTVWGNKVDIAITKANKGIERLDAAFNNNYTTKGLQEGAALATQAHLQQASPSVTGQARVAGLYGAKATPETIKQGLSTLALGENVSKVEGGVGFITKAQAIQNPIENHNILVTGLATNVADNAADAKTNYRMYAKSYINATMPYIVDIKATGAGGKTEVRATTDFSDSLNGVFSVTNRNDSFVDELWNNAAEKADTGVHQSLLRVRLQTLNSFSQAAYMELIGNYPELSQYVRPRDFFKSVENNNMTSASPIALVGNPSEADRKRIGTAISLYNQANSEYGGYFAKTNSYLSSVGTKVGE